MDLFLKRKIENSGENNTKSTKREICPHAVKCFRRNPHHFKEFDHPHLFDLIQMGTSIKIPSDYPQPDNIYLEQLDILKPLLKIPAKDILSTNSNMASNSSLTNKEKQSSSRDNHQELGTKTETKLKGKQIVSKEFQTVQNPLRFGSETMLDKLERTAPYNIFFTTIIKATQTRIQPNAITFTDLLCPSLGVLKNSLQINFMIDIDWLLKQYKERNLSSKPLTILYGDNWPDMEKFIELYCPNVTSKLVKMKDPFGCHHSKIGIYAYEDNSIRVVVSTANLYYEDWNHYNQGILASQEILDSTNFSSAPMVKVLFGGWSVNLTLWVSPALRRLPDSSSEKDGDSPTRFKSHFLTYLRTYNESILKPFIEYVQKADFSAIRVFFTYSAPGKYYPDSNGSHLHVVADLLSRHCVLPAKTTPQSEGSLAWGIIAQASSIGAMGKSPADWLRGSLLRCLASHKGCPKPMNSNASISIVYPSVDNVMSGYFGHESGGCLPYSKAANEKQRWLQEYMYRWKADSFGRTRAMPHIKTYCRISPCLSKLAYYLITSANLSKAAWGGPFGKDMGVYIRSYEAGVLFLPTFFGEEYFEIRNTADRKNKTLFPFMYDLPLTSYAKDDYPWCN